MPSTEDVRREYAGDVALPSVETMKSLSKAANVVNSVNNKVESVNRALFGLSNNDTKTNARKFVNSEGREYLENAKYARDIYEMSKLEGASPEEIGAFIDTRFGDAIQAEMDKAYKEEMQRLATSAPYREVTIAEEGGGGRDSWDEEAKRYANSIGEIVWNNYVSQIENIWKELPNLAHSDKYVIDEQTGEWIENDGKEHPRSTGEYLQIVANQFQKEGFPLLGNDLADIMDEERGIQSHSRSLGVLPNIAGSMIAPRMYSMFADDEIESRYGGKFKAGAGDAAEMALNFVPVFGLAGKALKGTKLVDKAIRLGEEGGRLARVASRGTKGAIANVAENVGVDKAGNVYDFFAGTDRGGDTDAFGNIIAAATGFGGRALGNSSRITWQKKDLFDKLWENNNELVLAKQKYYNDLMKTPEGRELIKKYNIKSWENANNMDDDWIQMSINRQMTPEEFASSAYGDLGDAKVHLNKDFTTDESTIRSIEDYNSKMAKRNREIASEEKQMNSDVKSLYEDIDAAEKERLFQEWLASQQKVVDDVEVKKLNLEDKKSNLKKTVDLDNKELQDYYDSIDNATEKYQFENWMDNVENATTDVNRAEDRLATAKSNVVPTSPSRNNSSFDIYSDPYFQLPYEDSNFNKTFVYDSEKKYSLPVKNKYTSPTEPKKPVDYKGYKGIEDTNLEASKKNVAEVENELATAKDNLSSSLVYPSESPKVKRKTLGYNDEPLLKSEVKSAEEELKKAEKIRDKALSTKYKEDDIPVEVPKERVSLPRYKMLKTLPQISETDIKSWEKFCHKYWKTLGYKSFESMAYDSKEGVKNKWISMINRHRANDIAGQTWRKGLGNSDNVYSLKDYKSEVNSRRKSSEQTESSKSEVSRAADEAEVDWLNNGMEFVDDIDNATRERFNMADAEAAFRYKYGQGKKIPMWKEPKYKGRDKAFWLSRDIGGSWLIPSVGKAMASRYKYPSLITEYGDGYQLHPAEEYKMKKNK